MNDVLMRLAAALEGRYRVERELGAGGMATVYLAHDLKHERDVAIKVLHPDLGAALGADRFLAEIKTTARLQHPHILPLLDSGAAAGLLYYVMPFVRGETLRARLDRDRQLSIADAVRIAREVAAALEHAHKQGIVHRDIKPENILLQDGAAVVADFGIALAVQQAGGQRMTQTGLSLGTPQYMSPEQAMGERTVDARSDLYALGAVTYEMLTGEAPFTGASVQAIVAKVLTERPVAPRTLRDTVPTAVEAAVLQALAKLPVDRPSSARHLADLLVLGDSASTNDGLASTSLNAIPLSRFRATLAVMCVVTAVAVGTSAWLWSTRDDEQADGQPLRSTLFLSENAADQVSGRPVIAPDGHAVAFVLADSTGQSTLRVRRLDSSMVYTITGTNGATQPMWSPDSRWIAYFAGRVLFRVEASGGRPQRIADVGEPRFTGLWLTNDVLVVSVIDSDALQTVSIKDGKKGEFYRGDNNTDVLSRLWPVGDGRRAIVRLFSASDAKAPYRFRPRRSRWLPREKNTTSGIAGA